MASIGGASGRLGFLSFVCVCVCVHMRRIHSVDKPRMDCRLNKFCFHDYFVYGLWPLTAVTKFIPMVPLW